MAQSKVRRELDRLDRRCVRLCNREDWLGEKTSKPNFRLLYSSVESYEAGNGIAILGVNPAGGPKDADSDKRRRGFRKQDYTAYLDDKWRGSPGRGQDSMQREVQAIAMVFCGASSAEASNAKGDSVSAPEKTIGREATRLLRTSPSANVIPFRHSRLKDIPIKLRVKGADIGWDLLCSAAPTIQVVITLANSIGRNRWDSIIWRTILENSEQVELNGPIAPDCEIPIDERRNYYYRETFIQNGPLKGALIIGLPAVVHLRGRDHKLSEKMFEVLAKRVEYHGLALS